MNNKVKIITGILALALVIAAAVILYGALTGGAGASTGQTTAEYRKICADKAKKMMDDNTDEIVLDVRTEAEFTEQRIPGAVLLPDTDVADRAAEVLPNKDALILVYCRSGRRSENAVRELVGMGYTNVHDFGGIIDWPYDTEAGN